MSFFKTLYCGNPSLGNVLNNLRYPRHHLQVCSVKQFHQANNHYQKNEDRENLHQPKSKYLLLFGVTAGSAAAVFYLASRNNVSLAKSVGSKDTKGTGKDNTDGFVKGLPVYGHEEVAKHTTSETGIWVTYKSGVYDVTKFAATHPGGNQILEAAGGPVDPFWDLYQQHDTPQVLELLETLRIVVDTLSITLVKDCHSELKRCLKRFEPFLMTRSEPFLVTRSELPGNYKDAYVTEKGDGLWANQPKRDPNLIMISERPCNAETPKALLGASYITPNHLFYVRHHLPVPEIDLDTYVIEVKSNEPGSKVLKLTLDDVKKFPKHTVTSALMCAGNRRSQMNQFKPTRGLNWGPGAVGNAVWAGARLKDVLEAAGVTPDEFKHVQFVGADFDATGKPYGSSIPLTTAMGERNDVILAYEMNGKPIPRDHGFPVRAFIPGTVGARCVKWLTAITVSKEESPSHWQQMDYKGFNPSVDPDENAYKNSTSIQFLPVTSAILSPENGAVVKVDEDFNVVVKGYAWSGGGQKILRVDLTGDQGKTWINGTIVNQDDMPAGRHWAWTLWTAKIPAQRGQREMEIWVKAIDSSYNNQPDEVANIWNVRGVLNNAFDKIKIKITR